MKIRFCASQAYVNLEDEYADVYAEFDVSEVPTKEQREAIEEEISESMEQWEEEKGDFCDFNYFACCRDACIKHGVKMVANPIVARFYI